ncbi:MAG: hypothetical protein E6R03_07505 [Hyphomicrobiaceae bacterium]|nr:MAG: hypothetical protein E6R03_07505 [Hyphomicrobiaceae bacterium]
MQALTTPDQMRRFHMAQVRAAIKLYAKTKLVPTRGVTITKLLEMAGTYTGDKYFCSQQGYEAAIKDLDNLLA